MEVLELSELRTLSITKQKVVLEDSKRVARGSTERLCYPIPKNYRFRLISDDNMTTWRNVAATVDDSTAVRDSCNLKHRRRAYFTACLLVHREAAEVQSIPS